MKLVYCARGYTDTSNLRMALLDINPEGRLDKEIEDIIEELDIMIHLANTHNDILKKFVEQSEHILNPKGEFKGNAESQQCTGSRTNSSLSEAENEKEKERGEREKSETAYQSFKQKADEVQARVVDHIRELQKLRQSAKKTAEDVRNQHAAHSTANIDQY
jgi:chlorite dismutase